MKQITLTITVTASQYNLRNTSKIFKWVNELQAAIDNWNMITVSSIYSCSFHVDISNNNITFYYCCKCRYNIGQVGITYLGLNYIILLEHIKCKPWMTWFFSCVRFDDIKIKLSIRMNDPFEWEQDIMFLHKCSQNTSFPCERCARPERSGIK